MPRIIEMSDAGADAAGGAADALRQRDEIFLARAGLEQRAREQRQIGQQIGRHAAEVEADIEIDHAIGRQLVRVEPRAGQRVALDRDRACWCGRDPRAPASGCWPAPRADRPLPAGP